VEDYMEREVERHRRSRAVSNLEDLENIGVKDIRDRHSKKKRRRFFRK
jgi:hypothetical protein